MGVVVWPLEGGRRGWEWEEWVHGPELEAGPPERLYPATGLMVGERSEKTQYTII